MARNRRIKSAREKQAELKSRALRIAAPIAFLIGAVIVGILLATAALLTKNWFFTSDFLAINEVVTHGNNRISEEEILTLVEIKTGETLLSVDLEGMAKRISAHPWVAKVEIHPKLLHTLMIEIEEFEPAILIAFDSIYVVNRRGKVFKKLMPEDKLLLPVITGVGREEYTKNPERSHKLIINAIEAVSEWEQAGLRQYDEVSEVHFSESGAIELVTKTQNVRVSLAEEEAYSIQYERLSIVFEEIKRRNLDVANVVLDLGARKDRVAVKLKLINDTKSVGSKKVFNESTSLFIKE